MPVLLVWALRCGVSLDWLGGNVRRQGLEPRTRWDTAGLTRTGPRLRWAAAPKLLTPSAVVALRSPAAAASVTYLDAA